MPFFIDVFHGFYRSPIVPTFIDIVPLLINFVPTNNLFLSFYVVATQSLATKCQTRVDSLSFVSHKRGVGHVCLFETGWCELLTIYDCVKGFGLWMVWRNLPPLRIVVCWQFAIILGTVSGKKLLYFWILSKLPPPPNLDHLYNFFWKPKTSI